MWLRGVIKALLLKELFGDRERKGSQEVMQTTSTVFLFQFCQVEAARYKYNKYTAESEAGKYTCLTCHTCPEVFVLFPQCGTRIKDNEIKNECKPCLLGKTYSSDEDRSSCEPFKPCTRCSTGWKEKCCLAILKMRSMCSNHVLLVATMAILLLIIIIIILSKCLSRINPSVPIVLLSKGSCKSKRKCKIYIYWKYSGEKYV